MEPKYLTKAHQKNSEAAMKQLEEWRNSPTDFGKLVEQMKINSTDKSLPLFTPPTPPSSPK
jgi:hypothetical protein